jgi:hypothetical protein
MPFTNDTRAFGHRINTNSLSQPFHPNQRNTSYNTLLKKKQLPPVRSTRHTQRTPRTPTTTMPNHDMSQKNRPPRLLNLQLSPASDKKFSTRNEEQSPLLRLPAEIQSCIFDYALGGNTIHISPYQGVVRTRLCEHAEDYDDVECKIVLDSPMDVRNDDRIPNHTTCLTHYSQTDKAIGLGLLGTSRTLYHRTCLLPFSKNRFVFDSRDSLQDGNILTQLFKRHINNTQARAFTDVIFDGYHIKDFGSGEPVALALMTGLKKKGLIFYRMSQMEVVQRAWYTAALLLAENKELLNFLKDVIGRGVADKAYAIDFKKHIGAWKRQHELKQSSLLPPSQQAAISEQ